MQEKLEKKETEFQSKVVAVLLVTVFITKITIFSWN